ncbi:hypothetical protein AB0F46_29470 [Streptomyces sp. NPDC026665]|uniref:hypothetical protein n=1 Tax=Streptomyces sp. NPDC026665 TaxID=3154798 RepID=UPI0033C4EA1E
MTQRNPIPPARRLIAAGIIRRLPGRTLTVRVTQAGVTGSSITKTARLAELHRQCAQDYATAAPRRTQPGLLLAAEPSGRRCPSAYPSDPTPCRGPVAVTVLDADNHGADGCEYHAARLLAALPGGRVYALPDAPDGAAHRVFKASTGGGQ